MKILTYNMHKGRSFFFRKYTVADIKKYLKITGADIILLQEIHGEHPKRIKNNFLDTPLEELAEDIWPHHTYGKNAVYGENHHGNAILSKYPIVNSGNIDISGTQFASRGLLHAVIAHPDRQFHVFCTHLDLFESARQKQAQLIAERIGELVGFDRPVILAGDFNDWRGRIAKNLSSKLNLLEVGQLKTFPSLFPIFSLDRVFFRGFSLEGMEVLHGQQWMWLSDHLPLTVEFRFET